mmetsp:Transcript_126456/g.316136  ORF Transcript_126456/g.316136 Transcript_126456/m.316136 type:complete len:220 (-) Transcript_126456:54-713(-)
MLTQGIAISLSLSRCRSTSPRLCSRTCLSITRILLATPRTRSLRRPQTSVCPVAAVSASTIQRARRSPQSVTQRSSSPPSSAGIARRGTRGHTQIARATTRRHGAPKSGASWILVRAAASRRLLRLRTTWGMAPFRGSRSTTPTRHVGNRTPIPQRTRRRTRRWASTAPPMRSRINSVKSSALAWASTASRVTPRSRSTKLRSSTRRTLVAAAMRGTMV